ncbi:MAG: thioredoxin family protein, partial [Rhodospirillales bacterium]|nr:thioredoxin family protein [Rhodospirillales bacterium]
HSYWRNPGDAGAPATFHLDAPAGASIGPIAWPAPRRIAEGPLMTYAYTGGFLLTRRVALPEAGPVTVKATWLVCKEICVPEQAVFHLDLPAGAPAPSAEVPIFAAAARAVPRPASFAATLGADGTLFLRGPGLDPAAIARAAFIPDRPGLIRDAAPQTLDRRAGGIALALAPDKGFAAARAQAAARAGVLELVLRDGTRRAALIAPEPGTVPAAPSTAPPLAPLLLAGFLGGLILNLMPCVFPILAMKALAIAGAAQRARAPAAAYVAGVLVAFAALGGGMLALRAATGAVPGWGFQFASPAGVAAMALVIFAVGLNLSGVFAVGGRAGGIGQGLAARGGLAGSFFTGLLAVVVATPCTAPFMAAAIGGALAAPPLAGLAVFLALGAGLAAPMALLALMPGIGRLFPRPGAWMERLRHLLAFPMYGAVVWLVWVLSTEAGPDGVAAIGAGLVALGFAAWLLGEAQRGAAPVIGRAVAFVAMLAALAAPAWLAAAAPAAPGGHVLAAMPNQEAFSAARLAALRAAGRPVFVDVTASWCITCQLNRRVALEVAPVRAAFAARGVVYLLADWTRQDAPITAYLRAHGRDGVPLYVFYPPGAAHGRVLGQLLTPDSVLAALGTHANGG